MVCSPPRAVINQANAALQEHMSREHPALVEKYVIADLMKEIWKEKVPMYVLCLSGAGKAKEPARKYTRPAVENKQDDER